jgi:hypothetical protein
MNVEKTTCAGSIDTTGNSATKLYVCTVCTGHAFACKFHDILVSKLQTKGKLVPAKAHPAHVLTEGMLLQRTPEAFCEDVHGQKLVHICGHCSPDLNKGKTPAHSLANCYVLSRSNYHRRPCDPPTTVTTKPTQTWAEYLQSWTNMQQWTDYRESMAPADLTTYVPEPAYEESQELEIVCLVSAYDSPNNNNDAVDSLLDSPSDLIYAATGHMKVT